jgi:hypothetical protein
LLRQANVVEAELYVGKLSPIGKTWIVDETSRSVNRPVGLVSIEKQSDLAGEYRLLARVNPNKIGLDLLDYNEGPGRRNFFEAVPGGPQSATYSDGLEFTVISKAPYRVAGSLISGIKKTELPAGTTSVNSWRWSFKSNQPNTDLELLTINIPFSLVALKKLYPENSETASATVVWRKSEDQKWDDVPGGTISLGADGTSYDVLGTPKLDGEWAILAVTAKSKRDLEGVASGLQWTEVPLV